MSKSQPKRIARNGVLVALAAMAVAACGSTSAPATSSGAPIGTVNFNPPWLSANQNASGSPVNGGTLKIVGTNDIDHLDTANAYYSVSDTLERTYTRTLYNYPASTNIGTANTVVPDAASAMPSISADLKTYTIKIQPDVMWNTSPPRQVTSQDFARGLARLCTPGEGAGALVYYTKTIVGMQTYCDALGKVTADVPTIKAFMAANPISGITTPDAATIVITLTQPANDFLNILALPFGAAAPVEYLDYLVDSPDFQAHTLSDGPYAITTYKAAAEIDLAKNPVWKQSTDALRHQYVDTMVVTENASDASVQQQLATGTADMEWDTQVPTADLASLQSPSMDPRLGIFPTPQTNPYLVFNLHSTVGGSALQKVKVRQALEYAIDKVAMGKLYGGAAVNQPLNQVIPPGQVGYEKTDNYATPNNQGDAAKCKELLNATGVSGLTVTDVYRNSIQHPAIFQEVQKDFAACGVAVKGIEVTGGDFYTKYMQNSTASTTGVWDIAEPGFTPDWYGNNGRAIIEPMFDGRLDPNYSSDFGGYNSAAVNKEIDSALSAGSEADAAKSWQMADAQIMQDAAIIPFQTQFTPIFRSTRVHNAIFLPLTSRYDLTQVWLH